MTPRRRAHEDRRAALHARAEILAAVRAWFAEQGFLEADVSPLVASPGGEAHLRAFETELIRPDGGRERRYLATSPEFAMKKLIAAGERRIYDLARVFRNAEATSLHAPSFTMLEWYRAEEPWDAVMGDAIAILRLAAETTGIETMTWRERTCDPRAAPERLTVAEAFAAHAGVDLLSTLGAPSGASPSSPRVRPFGPARGRRFETPPSAAPQDEGEGVDDPSSPLILRSAQSAHLEGRGESPPDRDALAEQATRAGVACAADDSWSDLFARILVERVEPRLGLGRPTLLTEYPLPEAALARPCARDPRFAERFELYVCGVELANGYGELTDPIEQRRRLEAEMDLKEARTGARWPIDEELLDALAEMPETSGVALGVDRLVMLATGARSVADVLWTPPG